MSKWHDIESTAVKQIKYDSKGERMHVLFKNNQEYMYLNVPENVFNELLKAESFGSVFHKYVKNDYKSIDLGNRNNK